MGQQYWWLFQRVGGGCCSGFCTDYTQSLRLDGLQGKRIGLLNVEENWALNADAKANLERVIAALELSPLVMLLRLMKRTQKL